MITGVEKERRTYLPPYLTTVIQLHSVTVLQKVMSEGDDQHKTSVSHSLFLLAVVLLIPVKKMQIVSFAWVDIVCLTVNEVQCLGGILESMFLTPWESDTECCRES